MTTKTIRTASIQTCAANVVALSVRIMDMRASSQSISQQIAARIKANGMKANDRNTDDAKAFSKKLRDDVTSIAKLECPKHIKIDDLIAQSLNVLKTQISYAWNIVQTKGDANGRLLPAKTGANVATKKETPEQASAPATKQVEMKVTRDAALAFMATALGGNVAENEFALGYLLDNSSVMRAKLVTLVKVQFEAAAIRKAA